uniref:Uncharacterized protein n=1 Tax=Roseihalotalea indica TaxID=2867963 RepID=A0AA49GPJ1_9BACT|nr:hypothetical protein K4G66_05115 [Tunicatimonas sp. TK19036]
MKKRYFNYWLIFAIAGLILIGLGLSLFGEAIIAKYERQNWFWLGSLSLIIVNAGISLVGQSVVYRVKLIREKEQ